MTGVAVELKCFELECFDGSQDEGCRRCPEYVRQGNPRQAGPQNSE